MAIYISDPIKRPVALQTINWPRTDPRLSDDVNTRQFGLSCISYFHQSPWSKGAAGFNFAIELLAKYC